MTGADLRHVALAVWLTAWAGAVGAYLLSAMDGHVDWCVPHIEGCSSISKAGRHGWGYFVFKAFMLPSAAFGVVYWLLVAHWLRVMHDSHRRTDAAITFLGVTGAVFLVLYATFLGSDGDTYRLMRRYGTVVYFGFTFLAQLLFSRRARALCPEHRVTAIKVGLGLFMLIEGLVLAALTNLVEDDDWLENISEWHYATALTLYPVLTWVLWRQTGFRLSYSKGRPG